MISDAAQETNAERIQRYGRRAIAEEQLNREESLWLFGLERSADIWDLLAAANRVREHFKGNKIHLCSIVNAKAGGCSEDCKFCAQSAIWQGASPRYGFCRPRTGRRSGQRSKAQQRHRRRTSRRLEGIERRGRFWTKSANASAKWPPKAKPVPMHRSA